MENRIQTDSVKISVVGCGAWGTALAKIAAEKGHTVHLWCHEQQTADFINQEHENKNYLPGISLPLGLKATLNLPEALNQAHLIIIVTASQFFLPTLSDILPFCSNSTLILSATKGLSPETKERPSQMLARVLGLNNHNWAILTGPNLSREIAEGKVAATVISSPWEACAQSIQFLLNSNTLRVYTNTDVVGSELGGTLKNVIAIAAGIADGLEQGTNARSALMVRGLVEMVRFGRAFGALDETFYGLTGMGDLITTCSSELSRNHTVGVRLAQGEKLSEIIASTRAIAEGVETARLVASIAAEKGIDMPMTTRIAQILFEDLSPIQALHELMSRAPTRER